MYVFEAVSVSLNLLMISLVLARGGVLNTWPRDIQQYKGVRDNGKENGNCYEGFNRDNRK